MAISDLKNKNILADLHTDWEDKKSKFEYALSSYQAASDALKNHSDYSVEATTEEKSEIIDYDLKVEKINSEGLAPK